MTALRNARASQPIWRQRGVSHSTRVEFSGTTRRWIAASERIANRKPYSLLATRHSPFAPLLGRTILSFRGQHRDGHIADALAVLADENPIVAFHLGHRLDLFAELQFAGDLAVVIEMIAEDAGRVGDNVSLHRCAFVPFRSLDDPRRQFQTVGGNIRSESRHRRQDHDRRESGRRGYSQELHPMPRIPKHSFLRRSIRNAWHRSEEHTSELQS